MTVRYCPICDIAECATHRPTQSTDPVRVTVKPLVWDKGQHDREFAKTPFCQYSVRDFGNKSFWVDIDGSLLRPHHTTIELAKAAAQADYEARILAAIDTQPDPRDAVIAQLVEAIENIRSTYLLPPRFQLPLDLAITASLRDRHRGWSSKVVHPLFSCFNIHVACIGIED